ncbi:MAG: SAM-dependent methyltransferase [Actinomycetia bacterium]|nr:SAM-dependent methyltransferase [Actinomycetes bacterium]
MIKYKDTPAFCKSLKTEEVKKLNYSLSPGRYIGLSEEEDDFYFSKRFSELRK